jgi:hypothetical protein
MHPHRRARTALAITAGVVTVALTALAFWLSYEHLHDIAGAHLLTGSRAWAWPGTVDAFIIVGELLTLRASLNNRIDWWAIALAAFGSVGSIALNICGVGVRASALDYTVAAVPPTAALVAFGALMRQVHEALDRIADAPAPVADAPADTAFDRAASEATALAAPAPGTGALVLDLAPMLPPIREVTADAQPVAFVPQPAARPRPGGATATDEQLIVQARALAANGPLSLRRMQTALSIGQARAQRIRDALDNAPEETAS